MAKKRPQKKHECPAGERWAVPYADFLSLLLALFIALYALASVNQEKLKAIKEEFVKIYDYAAVTEPVESVVDATGESQTPNPSATSKTTGRTPVSKTGAILEGAGSIEQTSPGALEQLQKDLQKVSMGEGPLDQTMDGLLLKLPATIMFRGSNATIDDDELHLFLKRIADIINLLPSNVNISIRGYTDNLLLPAGSPFKDNHELSFHRANTVMRELIRDGVSPDRLSTAAFGASNPVAPNTNEDNRAKNRRVELYMFVSSRTPLSAEKQKDILDIIGKLQK